MLPSCLIVDDSPVFLASAARMLSAQGVVVLGQASTGDEAVRLVGTLRPDVALIDVELGDEDGIEVARRLTSGNSSVIVILISLRDYNELVELTVGSGAAGFLRKDALDAHAVEELVLDYRQKVDHQQKLERGDVEPKSPEAG